MDEYQIRLRDMGLRQFIEEQDIVEKKVKHYRVLAGFGLCENNLVYWSRLLKMNRHEMNRRYSG